MYSEEGATGYAMGASDDIPTACHLGLAAPYESLESIMAAHPDYTEQYVALYTALVTDPALPPADRAYIGMMAASRHKSFVLLEEQKQRFYDSDGDEEWLLGISHAPHRLQVLAQVNNILAHRPWELTHKHIKSLREAGFTLNEVVHALALLAFFHSMSSMLHAVGIEATLPGCHDRAAYTQPQLEPTFGGSPQNTEMAQELARGGVSVLVERLQRHSEGQLTGEDATPIVASLRSPLRSSSGSVRTSKNLDPSPTLDGCSQDLQYPEFARYAPNLDYSYTDFYGRRGSKSVATTLKYHHLWENYGYSVLEKFTSVELADAMDRKFSIAQSMTYMTCGDQDKVDTQQFRRAVWNYTQCLYGIRWDDYDYKNINIFMDKHLKMFLKSMSVAPERLTYGSENLSPIIDGLKDSEKVHVAILCGEARLQAGMVYGLQAVENYYMKHS